jgi:hypothetical protein
MRLHYPLLGLAAALFALPATAQVVDGGEPSSAAAGLVLDQRGAPLAKAGPEARLDDALRRLAALPQARQPGGDAYVVVDVVAASPAATAALRAQLVALGFEPTAEAGAVVSGRLPVSAIGAVAEIPALRSVMVPRYVRRAADGTDQIVPLVSGRAPAAAPAAARVGAVTGEASLALRAARARDLFDVDGAGVRIGVLSDSYANCDTRDDDPDFSCRTTAATDVETGDLPDDVLVLDDLDSGAGSDEGRAMMQLAYDVAPGATFAFHTAFEGYISFAGGVIDLFQAGSAVIVDDIGISTDPFFQDGLIAQAADYVVSQGATYFSSAGNSADASYEADFAPSDRVLTLETPSPDPRLPPRFDVYGELHDFDPGEGVDPFQDVQIFPGETLRFAFQYDEPSVLAAVDFSPYPALIGGAPGQTPTSDYDVFVLNEPTGDVTQAQILASSTNFNPVFGAPYEFIEYTHPADAEPAVIYVALTKFSGESRRLKYLNFGGSRFVIQEAEYVEPGTSTVYGHSNAAGTFATGAAPWFNTAPLNGFVRSRPEVFGAAAVASFTSYGGLDIRLDVNGDRLATPEDRMKPDATASDGDNNTFFGGDSGADADTLPNFFGTSAAAPNAAAVAALAVESNGGAADPEVLYGALEGTAADILNAVPFGFAFNVGAAPGFDDQTGFGLIRADLALGELAGDAIDAAPGSPLVFAGFDADGEGDPRGEFAALANDSEDEVVDLSAGTFVVFDPFTQSVTFAASPDALLGPGEAFVFATTGGDLALPPETLPDGPGAFAFVAGDAAVGDAVQSVLGRVIAAVVYVDEGTVIGGAEGRDGAASTAAFEAALDALGRATAGEDAGALDLALTTAPNPTAGRATVAFGLAEGADVRVAVYDALGREVAVLADGPLGVGRHALAFDGSALGAGVYVVRLEGPAEAQTARLTVVR